MYIYKHYLLLFNSLTEIITNNKLLYNKCFLVIYENLFNKISLHNILVVKRYYFYRDIIVFKLSNII